MMFWIIWALIKATVFVLYVVGAILYLALWMLWIGLAAIISFIAALVSKREVAT